MVCFAGVLAQICGTLINGVKPSPSLRGIRFHSIKSSLRRVSAGRDGVQLHRGDAGKKPVIASALAISCAFGERAFHLSIDSGIGRVVVENR